MVLKLSFNSAFFILHSALILAFADDGVESIHIESLLAQSLALEQRFQSQNLFFADNDVEVYLTEIVEKLATPDELKLFRPRVRVLRSEAVNAFAAPHGAIFVCTGLLARVTSEAQAAAFLAHELTHITNHHAAKNLMAQKTVAREKESVRQGLALLLGDGISGSITGAALRSAISGYNRDLEREADSVGLIRMAAAGYPHEEFYNLFSMILDHIVSEGIREQYFFSSHPRMVERLENYVRIVNTRGFAAKQVVPKTSITILGSSSSVRSSGSGKSSKQPIRKMEADAMERDYFCIRTRSVILYDAAMNRAAGKFDAADTQLDRLLAVDSADAEALIMRGDIERMLSPRSTAAMEWYLKAYKKNPDDVQAIRALGFAYHSIGDMKNAKKYLSRYCELAGDDAPDIKMAREMLK